MKNFEREIIIEFLKLSPIDVSPFFERDYEEEIEFSNDSYRLKLKDIGTQQECYFSDESSIDKRRIFGRIDGIDVGFSLIIQANDLTLECFSERVEITEENRNNGFERTKT